MKSTLSLLFLVFAFLAAIDIGVHTTLHWAEQNNRLQALVRYFEYGRSVPGKLNRWEANPDAPGNLIHVAWRPQILANSAERFEATNAGAAPVVRSYGMSFVNNILRAASEKNPDLILDAHSGPAAPPNFTYAVFEDDRQNRSADDIVVLGILSSSVPAMAAFSNSTWAFEQPAPFTYPIYHLEAGTLHRRDPVIEAYTELSGLNPDEAKRVAWYTQLEAEDYFYSSQTYGYTSLDGSPFARLVRRSLATAHISKVEARILGEEVYPYADVLRKMILEFAKTAREDRQYPVVMLIQSRDPADADVLAITKPVLDQENIPYLATAEHFDPRDQSGFQSDGHYQPRIDSIFAEAFLDMMAR